MRQSSAGKCTAFRSVISYFARILSIQTIRNHLSAYVRKSEPWLVLAASLIGCLVGLSTLAITALAHLLQVMLFRIGWEERLSAIDGLASNKLLLVPVAGGFVLLILFLIAKKVSKQLIDPIEANALHGGKLPLRDSLMIAAQTIVSNGTGASVGLEAAYTQIGAALGSKLGQVLHARRSDMRLLLGCGAGAAIAAAFGTPLAGAFYGFELIIGTYTISALAPMMAATISAVLITNFFTDGHISNFVINQHAFSLSEITAMMALALLTAIVGILVMMLVGNVERAFNFVRVKPIFRPMIGGLLLIPLIAFVPETLSAGHGAMNKAISNPPQAIFILVTLITAKALASAISIGSGFRGGLFFASLYLGALVGHLYFELANLFIPEVLVDPVLAAAVGMTGMAAAIVGGPLTMAFLALELFGSLPLATVVLAAATISSIVVRATFGYSFTTWRFHLRGETIRSAHDVGLVRNLTVGRMMRKDVKTVRLQISLREFCRITPLGSAKRVVVVDDSGNYAGIVSVEEAFAKFLEDEEAPLSIAIQQKDVWLEPNLAAKQALELFESTRSDTLAVIAQSATPNLLGQLNESYVLRRYSEELDRARNDLVGSQRTGKTSSRFTKPR